MSAFLTPDFISKYDNIAIGLSGGPDSMALTHMLSELCVKNNLSTEIHALNVNHNLRDDAQSDSEQVGEWVHDFPNLHYTILQWNSETTSSRIMEEARTARYQLMADYCKDANITLLYIAHHQDDQAETFLFRLAKGSGLDGLGGMKEVYSYTDRLKILRPLLEQPKDALIDYCTKNNLPYLNDPGNFKTEYARPRLRQSRDVLEQEGLTAKRLATTAKRLSRARAALDYIRDMAMADACEQKRNVIEMNLNALAKYPEEIRVRVLQKAIEFLTLEKKYAPRMEKIESLTEDLFTKQPFRKRTFAHIIFEITHDNNQKILCMSKET